MTVAAPAVLVAVVVAPPGRLPLLAEPPARREPPPPPPDAAVTLSEALGRRTSDGVVNRKEVCASRSFRRRSSRSCSSANRSLEGDRRSVCLSQGNKRVTTATNTFLAFLQKALTLVANGKDGRIKRQFSGCGFVCKKGGCGCEKVSS